MQEWSPLHPRVLSIFIGKVSLCLYCWELEPFTHPPYTYTIFKTREKLPHHPLPTGNSQHVHEYLPVSIYPLLLSVWSLRFLYSILRLNMETDLQSLFGLLCTAVLIGATPQLPPPLAFGLILYTRALLVSLERRHLFVTPCLNSTAPVGLWALRWVPRWYGRRQTWWRRPGRAWPSTGRRRDRWTRGRSAPGRPTGTRGGPRAALRTRTRNKRYNFFLQFSNRQASTG